MLRLVMSLMLVVPSVAAAQTTVWGEVRLAGGAAAARRVLQLGDPAGRWDAAVLMDVVRKFATSGTWQNSIAELDRYLRSMDAIQLGANRWGDGLRLPGTAVAGSERQAVKDYLELLGLSTREDRGRLTALVDDSEQAKQRGKWIAAIGYDREALAKQLNGGDTIKIVVPESTLPLPLPKFWETAVYERGHVPLVDLLRLRSSALLYAGLMSLDEETLEYLAGKPQLMTQLRQNGTPALAAFARSLRIRHGAVDLPGGAEAEPLWREVVGQKPKDVDEFIVNLFSRDEFRLAWFYDAIDHLDATRQKFVMGASVPAKSRASWFKDVYDVVTHPADTRWSLELRPFSRPIPDPTLMLSTIEIRDNGAAGPPWMASLLARAASNDAWPKKADDTLRVLDADQPADARWLVRWVYEQPKEADERFRMLRYFQRLSPGDERTRGADLDVALRGLRTMPMLMLATERMGLDVGTAAALARGAHTLMLSGGKDDVVPILSRWQASLALVEQMQRRRHLPADEMDALLQPLAAVAAYPRDKAGDAISAWLTTTFLPKFVADDVLPSAVETLATTAFVQPPSVTPISVSWDGLDYILDEYTQTLRNVRGIREASPTLKLGDVVALDRVRQRLAAGPKTADEIASIANELDQHVKTVAAAPKGLFTPKTLEALRDTLSALKGYKNNFARASRLAPDVASVVGLEIDVVVPPLVYALAAAPIVQPPAIYADAWKRHSLVSETFDLQAPWTKTSWQMPMSFDKSGGGSMVRGAWLGLDLVLAEGRMPRVSEDGIAASGPSLMDRAVFIAAIPIRTDLLRQDADFGPAIASLGRGRAQLKTWLQRPPARDVARTALVGALVDEWRVNIALWLLERHPEQAFIGLTAAEISRLGGAKGLPIPWGMPSMPFDGCLCLRAADGGFRDAARGYWNTGVMGAVANDLQLQIAEQLAALKVPLTLAVALLPEATSDWIWHTEPYNADDWEALAAWPKSVDRERVERYLNHLVSQGQLVKPPARGGGW